ncbi:hypothetical protein DEJ36_09635 [Curtobacterium sp. MCPF17_052]|nr:hypothetical protein [Curtobacterium sp. MCPF17_052]WIB11328.1 hypothetical protein DEJ36_09635 [Curtobacterium sp. MCPF17_052]
MTTRSLSPYTTSVGTFTEPRRPRSVVSLIARPATAAIVWAFDCRIARCWSVNEAGSMYPPLGVVPSHFRQPPGIEGEEVRDGLAVDDGTDPVDVDHCADKTPVPDVGGRLDGHLQRDPPADGGTHQEHVAAPVGEQVIQVGARQRGDRIDVIGT